MREELVQEEELKPRKPVKIASGKKTRKINNIDDQNAGETKYVDTQSMEEQIFSLRSQNELLFSENLNLKNKFSQVADELRVLVANRDAEKTEMKKYGIIDFVKSIFMAIEDLSSIEMFVPEEMKKEEDVSELLKGMGMAIRNILRIAEEFGVERVFPTIGDSFDPISHQAVSFENNNEHSRGKIVGVKRAGYRVHDRLAIPALVIVSAGSTS